MAERDADGGAGGTVDQGPRMMKRPRRIATAALVAALLALASAPAGATGALAGTGTAARSGCPAGPIAVSGAQSSGANWTFSVSYANTSSTACAFAESTTVGGVRDAAGCVAQATGRICVSPLPPPGGTTVAAVTVCFPLNTCYTGSATLSRAGTA